MAVRGWPYHAPPAGIIRFILLGPIVRGKMPGGSIKSGIRDIRPAHPGPFSRMGGGNPDPKNIAAIPEAVDTLAKTRSCQVDPYLYLKIRIHVCVFGLKYDFDFLPDTNFPDLVLFLTHVNRLLCTTGQLSSPFSNGYA